MKTSGEKDLELMSVTQENNRINDEKDSKLKDMEKNFETIKRIKAKEA